MSCSDAHRLGSSDWRRRHAHRPGGPERWGVLDLLDVLKNADFTTGFTNEFASAAAYERIDRATLQRACCSRCSRWARTWASARRTAEAFPAAPSAGTSLS
ncbi:hypothetical protein [Streptomyces sp. NPDC055681]